MNGTTTYERLLVNTVNVNVVIYLYDNCYRLLFRIAAGYMTTLKYRFCEFNAMFYIVVLSVLTLSTNK